MSWLAPRVAAIAETTASIPQTPAVESTGISNPFEGLFSTNTVPSDSVHMQFVRRVFSQATTDVGVFVVGVGKDSRPGTLNQAGQHIILPFFGGPSHPSWHALGCRLILLIIIDRP